MYLHRVAMVYTLNLTIEAIQRITLISLFLQNKLLVFVYELQTYFNVIGMMVPQLIDGCVIHHGNLI